MPEVELAYLFGSQAQGRARPASDIDVAVLVSEAAAADARAELARLFDRVGAAVGSHRLDLVLLNGAPSLLRHRVVSRGRLLLARDACQRVRFIARAIQDVRRGRFYRRRVERIRTGTGDDRSGDLLAQARRVARLLGEAARVP